MSVQPPFAEYHFIDLDNERVRTLEELAADHAGVRLYHGDANRVLIDNIYPRLGYANYRRALCLLDPYGLQLDWDVIERAGELGTVEIFLNFPIHDMNRNVLIRDPSKMDLRQVQRMEEKVCTNDGLAEAFRQRLLEAAGFAHVPEPVYMRNSNRAGLYYLFFAAQRPVAANIVGDIFDGYRAGTGDRLF